jgi:hypothetical protein
VLHRRPEKPWLRLLAPPLGDRRAARLDARADDDHAPADAILDPVGQPFGYVSAAEGFVLLSAFVAGLVYTSASSVTARR